jgi:hypothetical protein
VYFTSILQLYLLIIVISLKALKKGGIIIPDDVKIYLIDGFSILAKNLEEAVKKTKKMLDVSPETILKKVD